MGTETTTKSPTAVADKPAAPKFDAFNPEMPQIPGVNKAQSRSGGIDTQRLALVGGAIAAAVVLGMVIFWWIKSGKSAESPATELTSESSSAPPPSFSIPPMKAHEGPTVAASVEELSKPWSAKKFIFVNPVTDKSVDAMVIRLPNGGLWAFSLQEPYGQCELEFVIDVGRLASQFGYQARHPMVVNPCNKTIYDPTKVGTLGGDVWVRGEIVQGEGVRPPISIDVRVQDHSIIADSIE